MFECCTGCGVILFFLAPSEFPEFQMKCLNLSLIVIVAFLLPLDCHAYIDPNAGGWLFQMLFPLLVALGGIWAIFRRRVLELWHRLFRRSDGRE